jgi:hypothetical protein
MKHKLTKAQGRRIGRHDLVGKKVDIELSTREKLPFADAVYHDGRKVAGGLDLTDGSWLRGLWLSILHRKWRN